MNTLKTVIRVLALSAIFSSLAYADLPEPFKYVKRYSAAGELLAEISPDPATGTAHYPAVRYTYDSTRRLLIKTEQGVLSGWPSETTAPASWGGLFQVSRQTLYTYDSYGRKIREVVADAGGAVEARTDYAYDAQSRVLCKTVRLNPASAPSDACTLGTSGSYGPDRITRYEYNISGKVLRERRAVGTSLEQVYVEYAYTPEDQIETVKDANGNTAKFEYDDYGRKSKWCFPNEGGAQNYNCNDYESYAYDVNANRTQLRKRDGQIIGYQYDNLNRMVYKNIPNTSANDVYYRYELSGAQLYARFGSHSGQGITTNYTGFGEPEQDSVNLGGVTRTVQRQFDANGNRTRITHPDNQYFTYQYDGLDRLQTIRENGGAVLISDEYDELARPESRFTAGNAMTFLGYDDVSRLNAIEYQFAGLADDLMVNFGYNPAGQLVQKSLSNGVYHHAGGLGNLGDYIVNGRNEYLKVNGVTFTYDANGNLTSDGSKTYTYDVENRLISVSGATTATLSYDPMGRLYSYATGGTTTQFLYDGDSLVAEYVSGNVSKRYVHGTSVDTPLVQYTGSTLGTRQFLHKNHQGSVIAASSNTGATAYINTYDAYGVPATGNQGRFGYTGQMYLSELKLYHYRARVYNPHVGRFMQTDPVGYEDQVNLYAYVGNDPMNATDPSGMATWEEAAKTFATRAAAAGTASQLDTPALGPGDVVGAGILLYGVGELVGNLVSENAEISEESNLDVDSASESGQELDPADKGGELTKAGRALDKHGSRDGSAFPQATGTPQDKNQQGQDVLDDILTDPGSTTGENKRFGGTDVFDSSGRGARFDKEGKFRGFLEPRK